MWDTGKDDEPEPRDEVMGCGLATDTRPGEGGSGCGLATQTGPSEVGSSPTNEAVG